MKHLEFGPATEELKTFIKSWEDTPWFSRIETEHPRDSELKRISLEELMDLALLEMEEGQENDLWKGLLGRKEGEFEKPIFSSSRLGLQDAVTKELGNPIDMMPVSETLLNKYDEYYKDSFTYPEELVEFSARIIRSAAHEILVSDLDDSLRFFQDLMPWIREGYWPCGWDGDWPNGKLILL